MPTYFLIFQFLYCKNQLSGADSEFLKPILNNGYVYTNLNVSPKYLQIFPFQCEFSSKLGMGSKWKG